MTRLQADLLLLVTAVIWGTAFIAQKTGMDGLGPLGFVGARFVLSFLVVLPFALLENRRSRAARFGSTEWRLVAGLSLVCAVGVTLQQYGVLHTTITNAGFLTGLYVVFVPFFSWILFRRRPGWGMGLASLLALAGVFMLNGGGVSPLGAGDGLVIACAVFFAMHLILTGLILQRAARPVTLVAVQYGVCAVVGLCGGIVIEGLVWADILNNLGPLLYAGVISGGIAYTLQAIAQQYTPPSDAGVILSGEALFAALAGAVLLGDRLDTAGLMGCALILAAVLLVELRNVLFRAVSRAWPKKAFAPGPVDL